MNLRGLGMAFPPEPDRVHQRPGQKPVRSHRGKRHTPVATVTHAGPSPSRSVTTYYGVNMSVNVSVRLDDRLAERLRLRANAAGETLSDRLRRYAEEGARRDEHPLITFRDGPLGRRAGVIGGPDVWEIAMWIEEAGGADDLITDQIITRPQADAALAYRAAYPVEIQARIDLHRDDTAAASSR